MEKKIGNESMWRERFVACRLKSDSSQIGGYQVLQMPLKLKAKTRIVNKYCKTANDQTDHGHK